MPSADTLVAFAFVSAGIMLVPGPSNLFLLAHGVRHGRRSALAAAGGIGVASAVRVLLTAAGLSALLASSAIAFGVVRWAGVIYLLYLGIRAFMDRRSAGSCALSDDPAPLLRSARKGLIVGLGNPKMVIFFLAFFPQFVHQSQGSAVAQILVLGAIFWVIGAVWDAVFAYASGSVGSWLEHRPRTRRVQARIEGAIYVGLAGWAALGDAS